MIFSFFLLFMKTEILDDIAKELKTDISNLPNCFQIQQEAMKYIAQNMDYYSDEEIRYAILYLFK